jgi:thioesterase domain-containing protein
VTSALAALHATLRNELPVTRSLGIRPVSYSHGIVTLQAPLRTNVNHRGTAFAGSLNAIATLAGWSLVWLALREHAVPGQVIIQDSSIQYLRPVAADFWARSGPADGVALERLFAAVRRRRRGRIAVEAVVGDRGGPAVAFAGRYVVQGMPAAGEGRQ